MHRNIRFNKSCTGYTSGYKFYFHLLFICKCDFVLLNTWDGNYALFANSLDSDFSLIETLLMTQHSGLEIIFMCLNCTNCQIVAWGH